MALTMLFLLAILPENTARVCIKESIDITPKGKIFSKNARIYSKKCQDTCYPVSVEVAYAVVKTKTITVGCTTSGSLLNPQRIRDPKTNLISLKCNNGYKEDSAFYPVEIVKDSKNNNMLHTKFKKFVIACSPL